MDFGQKHPLERKWTVWFDAVDKKAKQSMETWGQTLRAVFTISTVEDFWWYVSSALFVCPYRAVGSVLCDFLL